MTVFTPFSRRKPSSLSLRREMTTIPPRDPSESLRDLAQALQEAQKALAANPHSVFAYVLVGELSEAQGDLQGALGAYEAALSEFCRQHPNGPAPPLLLVQKSAKLRARIRLQR